MLLEAIERLCKDMGINFYCVNPFHEELTNPYEDEKVLHQIAPRDGHPSVSYQKMQCILYSTNNI